MVEFDREVIVKEERKIIKEDKKPNSWKFFSILMFILIIVLSLVLIKIYKDKIKEVDKAYNTGLQNGTVKGFALGKAQCIICPQCICKEETCPICESPNQTVLNLAKEQTETSNIILFNGSHIVSLPLNSLCEQLKKNV